MPVEPRAWTRRLILLLIGASAITLGSHLSIPMPGTPVPQSAQTLAVLLVGFGLGPVAGGLAVVAYLIAGGLGLPVFADGASGWDHLIGPTAGYLFGFLSAAIMVGFASERWWGQRTAALVLLMLGAHAIILVMGWAWLSRLLGISGAYDSGVAPFLLGGFFKSLFAVAIIVVFLKLAPSVSGRHTRTTA